jgi:deoxycytidine triphosphate deaminase
MAIKSDKWIRRMAAEHGMIEPFSPELVREVNGQKIVSYGTSSYGYDIRCAREFKVVTNINSTVVDPKNFDPKSFVEIESDVCIIPPNSFALARTVEYFRIPRSVLTVCLGKSTYARCGIIVNVTPLEPENREAHRDVFRIDVEVGSACDFARTEQETFSVPVNVDSHDGSRGDARRIDGLGTDVRVLQDVGEFTNSRLDFALLVFGRVVAAVFFEVALGTRHLDSLDDFRTSGRRQSFEFEREAVERFLGEPHGSHGENLL